VLAFVLSAAIAALLFYTVKPWVNRSKRHLLEQDLIIRYALIVVGAFGAYSLGANNIANVVGVFVPVSPFKDISVGNLFTITGLQQLYLMGALSIVVGIYTYSHKVMRTVGKDLFHLSPITALVALLAEALVLFLFASGACTTIAESAFANHSAGSGFIHAGDCGSSGRHRAGQGWQKHPLQHFSPDIPGLGGSPVDRFSDLLYCTLHHSKCL
jgi:hypothetical protein